MNKDLKGIILFAGLFLFICVLLLVLTLIIQVLELTPLCQPSDEKEICTALIIYAILTTKFFQIIGLIWMSIYGTKKTHNPLIKKIFNTWKIPTLIFLICTIFDACINFIIYSINKNFYDYYINTYNFFIALSSNFLVIFIFSIGNQIIKLIKDKIQQSKRWHARQRNSWQLL